MAAASSSSTPIATHFAICAVERQHKQAIMEDIGAGGSGPSAATDDYYRHHEDGGNVHHSHSAHEHGDNGDDGDGGGGGSAAVDMGVGDGYDNDQQSSSSLGGPAAWSFADSGKNRLLSRDGSPHATDEVFNSVSHLSAAMISLLGTVLLIVQSGSNAWKIVSFSLYGASLMFLFMCSTLHHAISSTPEVEARLRMLDYLAIYPLIAGTFTPFCLVFLHDSVIGWSFFGVAWFLALVGMFLTAKFGPQRIPKWMSMTMYITIGWLGGILALWLLPEIGYEGLVVFVLGGVWFTLGGYVYTMERPNPVPGKFGFHEIWHIAVILGATFHYAVMYFYVLPWEKGGGGN